MRIRRFLTTISTLSVHLPVNSQVNHRFHYVWKGVELGWIGHSPVNSQVNRRSRDVLRWVEVGWMGHSPVNSQVKQRFHYVLKWVGWAIRL